MSIEPIRVGGMGVEPFWYFELFSKGWFEPAYSTFVAMIAFFSRDVFERLALVVGNFHKVVAVGDRVLLCCSESCADGALVGRSRPSKIAYRWRLSDVDMERWWVGRRVYVVVYFHWVMRLRALRRTAVEDWAEICAAVYQDMFEVSEVMWVLLFVGEDLLLWLVCFRHTEYDGKCKIKCLMCRRSMLMWPMRYSRGNIY